MPKPPKDEFTYSQYVSKPVAGIGQFSYEKGEKVCWTCKKPFPTTSRTAKYCPICRPARRAETTRKADIKRGKIRIKLDSTTDPR